MSEDLLSKSLPELGDECEKLWIKIVETEEKATQKKLVQEYNIIAEAYNKVAGQEIMTIITPKTVLSNSKQEDELSQKKTKPPNELKIGSIIKFLFAGSSFDGKVIELFTETNTLKVKGSDGCKYHIKFSDIMKPGTNARQHIAAQEKVNKQHHQDGEKEPKERKPRKGGGDIPPPNVSARELNKMVLTPKIEAILKKDVPGAVKIREVYDLNPKGFDVQDFETMSGINKSRIIGCLRKYDKAKDFKL